MNAAAPPILHCPVCGQDAASYDDDSQTFRRTCSCEGSEFSLCSCGEGHVAPGDEGPLFDVSEPTGNCLPVSLAEIATDEFFAPTAEDLVDLRDTRPGTIRGITLANGERGLVQRVSR